MADNLFPQELSELESKLERFYSSAAPDPLFAARLESQLIDRATSFQAATSSPAFGRTGLFAGFFRRPLLVGIAAFLLVLLVSISLIGPQKVLAEVQRLLGYLPGYGFVEPDQTLYLPAPVTVQQGDFTLEVTGVVADSKATQVNFTVTGLPHQKFNPTEGYGLPAMYLVLPDSTHLSETAASVGIGNDLQASVSFPALPNGVDHVTLVVPSLPSLPPGFAPDNWSAVLVLQAARTTGPAGSEATTSAVLVQPYVPENASATARGVTVRVLQVAQGPQETGIQVQYTWQDPDWIQLSGTPGQLSDGAGSTYQGIPLSFGQGVEPSSGAVTPGLTVRTLRFKAAALVPQKYVLTIDQMMFDARQDLTFTFDPGPSAKIGQTWDLTGVPGMSFDVAGIPVKITSATLDEVHNALSNMDPEVSYRLAFDGQSTPKNGLELGAMEVDLNSRPTNQGFEGGPDRPFRLYIYLPKVPDQVLSIHISKASLSVAGPWQIEWTPPSK